MKTIILVSGAIANKPGNGGEAWVRMSWASGLRRLGFDVWFVEQIAGTMCLDSAGAQTTVCESVNFHHFRSVMHRFGFDDRAALLATSDDGKLPQSIGVELPALLAVAAESRLLVNISGHLTEPAILEKVRRTAYVDIDPGYTQIWHADQTLSFRVPAHDDYFTIGVNIGRTDCTIPVSEIHWRPVVQPVVLSDWPVAPAPLEAGRFTTIASWRGAFGPVDLNGRRLGVKAHEFRKVLDLPERLNSRGNRQTRSFEVALSIHPADESDRRSLLAHGWHLVDPAGMGNVDGFHRYVCTSAAEFSVAQGVYVDTHSGWFSDRTTRYLAAGRPAVVQATGFDTYLPTGEGLLQFSTVDQAAAACEAVLADYPRHARAAREIAAQHFDSDLVLRAFLSDAGVELPGTACC
jgi:hypothetical protein